MQKYIKESYAIFILSLPIIFAQVSHTSMGVIDTVMSSSVNKIDMSSVSIGNAIWLPLILLGHGILLSLTPIISQFNGANKRNLISNQIFQGFWLAAGLSLIIMLILFNSDKAIYYMPSISNELKYKTVTFLRYLLWGVPGYLFFQVLKCTCDGLSKTKPGMIIGIFGLSFNIMINYIFIYGKFGIPAFGGIGCGITTSFVYWIMFLLLYIYVSMSDEFNKMGSLKSFYKPNVASLKYLIKLGLPIALALFFEVTLFTLVSLILTPFGINAIAGHQITMNFSSLIFVIPLSISIASTIKIGFELGKEQIEESKISSISSLIVGIMLSTFTALMTLIFRRQIVSLYNQDPSVILIAYNLMLLSAIYQIVDSVQVIGSGILRGFNDTKSVFFITFFSYWMIGLPLGYILGTTYLINQPMGPFGFWIGFIIGLTLSSTLTLLRIYTIQQQTKEKILSKVNKNFNNINC